MISFSLTALQQFQFWIENNKKTALRILRLIEEIRRTRFEGIGKREPLKGDFQGFWSRPYY
jgi:toxin YoeB